MKLVFDVGMYDGSDTEYYLSEGYKVVAVEANPDLVKKNANKFKEMVSSGQLILVNRAITDIPGNDVFLNICGDDLGSSSIFKKNKSHKNYLGSHTIKGITLLELIENYGEPYFIKIDIEGADRFCILPLNNNNRPEYISFEAGDDIEELVIHLNKIGYSKFKAINQCNFFELNNQETLIYRIKRKIIYLLGYKEPIYVKKNNRFFRLGHSAGPAPWESDGKWQDADILLNKWNIAKSNNKLGGWYDVHAK